LRGRINDVGGDFAGQSTWPDAQDTNSVKGKWSHLTVTKTAVNVITVYLNGAEIKTQAVTNYPALTTGTLVNNYFGKSPYHDTINNPIPSGVITWGNDLARTGFYHLAVDTAAWDAAKVADRYGKAPVGTSKALNTWVSEVDQ
jgi:hypothetical protein